MKKNGVTKRTWNKNAKKFSAERNEAWRDLNAFVESHCKIDWTEDVQSAEKKREKFLDSLCKVVDRYIALNNEMLTWCHKNGVDPNDFFCDVMNETEV